MFPKTITILVVDDMRTMRKIVQKACVDLGYNSFVDAEDGVVAWAKLQETPIDLVISDWNMPNMSGLDLLKKVRGDAKLKGTPFLLLTAESEAEQVKTALLAGVDNYLVKPFSGAALGEKIAAIYKRRFPKAG
jgi:two-component system, chemotaxis family, chemotaxis protein CheY